jgi:hypothetical protein
VRASTTKGQRQVWPGRPRTAPVLRLGGMLKRMAEALLTYLRVLAELKARQYIWPPDLAAIVYADFRLHQARAELIRVALNTSTPPVTPRRPES